MQPQDTPDVRTRLSLLFLASEAFPLAKTGGLADVCGALPVILARLGVDVRLMLPAYPQALDVAVDKRLLAELPDRFGDGESRLIAARTPQAELPVILFDCPRLFRRDGGLYQDASGDDWHDNHRRFAAFCRAAQHVALGRAGWRPDIVHANDWHTGLVPALLAHAGVPRPRSVFTIHNLAFQGNFPIEVFPALGLPDHVLSADGIEFYRQVSFLKAGIRYSDRLTTVSPNYAREILTPEHGCGLDGLLRTRARDLVGILNGVDYQIWDPATDVELPSRYSADDRTGKQACKAGLRQELGLAQDTAMPLIIFANRLTHQKMADVLLDAVPRLVASGAQLVVQGEGERRFEAGFVAAQSRYPGQVAVNIGYREDLAHRMHAGADISLTPSRFEPCGLTTMYAMRYGALPVTRPVGGLADTVTDPEQGRDCGAEGTGFVFGDSTAEALGKCVDRAVRWYAERPSWDELQHRAMKRDFGWERSAQRYLDLYAGLVAAKPT
jgi:starch synthase